MSLIGVALMAVLLTACGITQYLATDHAASCLAGTGLAVTRGNLLVPKEIKSGPRKVPKFDVQGGPNDHFAFGNHAVIVVTPDNSALHDMIMYGGPAFYVGTKGYNLPPRSFPTGTSIADYRNYVVVWDQSPSQDQIKLVEGCLR